MKRILSLVLMTRFLLLPAVGQSQGSPSIRPNILWITSEDHGPHMGCYGDTFATTPNVDRLAAKGMIYLHCWSNAPVCAPARTTIISGLYPCSTGSEHMRSMVAFPIGKKMFPQFLREAGYYCTNNAKEDYNLEKPGQVWDVSSRQGHWSNRKPGQPFFAVFNSEKSHESQIRIRPHTWVHDPSRVRIPAYHPDTPEVRKDWAQYYDQVTEADADAGKRLKELEEDGLAEDTIVFYYADHGSGMPRSKRWPYNSGLQVPLVVYVPEKWRSLAPPEYRPGGKSERLVSFAALAPTVLSLAGIKPPGWMQGHAFMGKYTAPSQPFLYGSRGRMDERNDLVRSVTDGRHVYIRNYMPHKIYGQHVEYMFQTPTTVVWKQLHDEGKLNREQDSFWNPKPPEELYDLNNDRDEVKNLARSPAHRDILAKFHRAQQQWAANIRDVGFLPEGEIHSRSVGSTPYDMGHDDAKYPFKRVFETADLASNGKLDALPALVKVSKDPDSAVRYWAMLGIQMRGRMRSEAADKALTDGLVDSSPFVRIVTAQTLARDGNPDLPNSLSELVRLADPAKSDVFVSIAALDALDSLGMLAKPVLDQLKGFAKQGNLPHERYSPYVPRLLDDILIRLAGSTGVKNE